MGYNGVSTREIARLAEVNESSLYRYYPHKRDLFLAVLESELQKLNLRAEQVAKLGNATDGSTTLSALFEVITETVTKQPRLIRLLQFSALEFKAEFEPIFREQLYKVVDAAAGYLSRRSAQAGMNCLNPHLTILSLVATVVTIQNFYPMIAGKQLPYESMEGAVCAYSEMWFAALTLPR